GGEVRARQDLEAALLAEAVVLAMRRARLRHAVDARGRLHVRRDETEALLGTPTVAGDEELFGVDRPQARGPVDDVVVELGGGAGRRKQLELVLQSAGRCRLLDAALIATPCRDRGQAAEVEHRATC